MNSLRSFFLSAAVALVASAPAKAGPVMTFEELSDGATTVDGFYGNGVTWVNEQILNSVGTPSLSPYAGPNPSQANVLARISCTACELELVSVSAIETISLSGSTTSGNLQVFAFNALNAQVATLLLDTDQQSVGCPIVTSWSCNRSFDFTTLQDIHRLQFITSGVGVLDNVQVTTYAGTGGGELPESGTLALAAAALLGLAATRRRTSGSSSFEDRLPR